MLGHIDIHAAALVMGTLPGFFNKEFSLIFLEYLEGSHQIQLVFKEGPPLEGVNIYLRYLEFFKEDLFLLFLINIFFNINDIK